MNDKQKRLEDYQGVDRVVSSHMLKKELGEMPPPSVQLACGLSCIENQIFNFAGGELVTLTGPSGHGKTLLSQTFVKAFSDNGEKGLVFTYEVPPAQFLDQFGSDLPLFLLPRELTSGNLGWIEERIIEAKYKGMIKYVVIDHLHYLLDMGSIKNASLFIGAIMRELKLMAVKYNIVIFLIAHLTKIEPGVEPDVQHLRDSSFIVQESDTVLLIWRSKKDYGAVCKIGKNRRYGVMNKTVYLIKDGPYLIDDTAENLSNG